MMTYTLLKSDNLSRAKDLLEKYKFNVEGYVKEHLWNLYRLKKAKRPRVNVILVSVIPKFSMIFSFATTFLSRS